MTPILIKVLPVAMLLAQATGYRPSSAELDAVRAQTTALIDCWYRKMDEPCFWSKVLPNSRIVTDPQAKAEAFAGAFVGKPDPAKLELGVERLGAPDRLSVLNADPKADGFYVVPGLYYLKTVIQLDATELAEARRAGVLPATDDFLVAVYGVSGEGYREEGIGLFWVKDAGVWKLFGLRGFD